MLFCACVFYCLLSSDGDAGHDDDDDDDGVFFIIIIGISSFFLLRDRNCNSFAFVKQYLK